MTRVECRRCGEPFDVDRDGVAPGQDTTRCPQCG
jgi:DNA-directed RNA polymerase subunit RPC12/RpoP